MGPPALPCPSCLHHATRSASSASSNYLPPKGLHLVVQDDLVQLEARDGEGSALWVAEAGATNLGVSHTLRMAMLDLRETGESLSGIPAP